MYAPIEVCCIYASADEPSRQTLEKHVSAMKRQGLISLWHDQQIAPGQDRIEAMDAHLNSSAVILLLVSPDFLASDDCYEVALQRAMERHSRNEARVVPVLVRPVDWRGASFARLAMLPTEGKPITLWRNRDAAWVDVAKGVRTVVEGGTLPLASAQQMSYIPIWNIPFPRNPYFTGRDEMLESLAQALQRAPRAALSQPKAITGLGGIGKTQIALEYVYQHRDDYQAILWCHAETREGLIAGYVALADLLGLSVKDEKDQLVIVQAVMTWLLAHERWLLILDNADDLSLVQEFLPTASIGHVVLTTRRASMGRLAQCLEVDIMTPDAGAVFVLRRAGLLALDAPLQQAAPQEVSLARQLVQEMGGLPLALDQASAYIEEARCSLSDYLSLYRSGHTTLLNERGGIVQDHPAAVTKTLSLSFAKVEQASPVAADLLRVCAFLQSDAIPEEIFIGGASKLGDHLQVLSNNPLAFNNAIKVLRSYSLLQRDPDGHLLSVHRLVQVVLKDMMDQAVFRQWAERVVEAINAVLPDDVEYRTWKQYERCLVHALGCVSLSDDRGLTSLAVARLLRQVGRYLCDHARYAEAEPLYKRALVIREESLGYKHPEMASLLNNLAELYLDQAKYAEAEPLYKRALTIWEESLGDKHPQVAFVLNNLANLYKEQGKYAEAEPLYKRALTIREESLGDEHPQVAYPLNNLAELYFMQGKYAEAEPLYKRALTIREESLGEMHPEVSYPLAGLAALYKEQGRYIEAESFYQRALVIREQHWGRTHPFTQDIREDYADFLRRVGRDAEARALDPDHEPAEQEDH